MKKIINDMLAVYKDMQSEQFYNLFSKYFSDATFIETLKNQYASMIRNVKSIDALLSISNLEDAYTIFRKYIETYILSISVIENSDCASKFIKHNTLLTYKANGVNLDMVRSFYKDKPDGFLQYGYIEDKVDSTEEDFRYSIRTVASVSNVIEYYDWYRISNNFVHNNTSGMSIDLEDGINKLISLIRISSEHYIKRLLSIIKELMQ